MTRSVVDLDAEELLPEVVRLVGPSVDPFEEDAIYTCLKWCQPKTSAHAAAAKPVVLDREEWSEEHDLRSRTQVAAGGSLGSSQSSANLRHLVPTLRDFRSGRSQTNQQRCCTRWRGSRVRACAKLPHAVLPEKHLSACSGNVRQGK